MGDHQHVAARGVDGDASREAVGAEFRSERDALLPVACRRARTRLVIVRSLIPASQRGSLPARPVGLDFGFLATYIGDAGN